MQKFLFHYYILQMSSRKLIFNILCLDYPCFEFISVQEVNITTVLLDYFCYLSIILLKIKWICVPLYVQSSTLITACLWRSRTTSKSRFSLSPMWDLGSNPGQYAWWQAPLSNDPPNWLLSLIFFKNKCIFSSLPKDSCFIYLSVFVCIFVSVFQLYTGTKEG